jgi:branched-chain amino acid transport system permease protein
MTAVMAEAKRRWRDTESLRATPPGRAGAWAIQAVAFVVFIQVVFNPPRGVYFSGMCVGALYGIVGVGVVLVYRTHRIINFAAAGLGAVPGIGLALLVALHGFSWWAAFAIAIAGGAVLGGLVDLLLIRRFAKSPRLILTVATIGVSQILAYLAFQNGLRLGTKGKSAQMVSPFSKSFFVIGSDRYSYDYLMTLFTVIVAVTGLGLFLRYTRIGIAMRASAENADRAALLGIPVKLVQTASWVLAGMLASVTIFLRSSLVGVPSNGDLGTKVLLFALSAAVIARMDSVPRCLVAGIGIGILGDTILANTGNDNLVVAYLFLVLLVVLLTQRGKLSRAEDVSASSWQAVPEFRPIPLELRAVREVVAARVVLGLLVLIAAIAAPFVVRASLLGFLNLIVISAMVAVSLVILTGWAGQISLGQFGIVGVGAVMVGKLVGDHNADFFLTLILAMVAGAVVAVLVGLPALRIRGLYLAVTTLAFAGMMESFVLNKSFRLAQIVLPQDGHEIHLPILWGRVELGNELGLANRSFYFLCLVLLGASLLMARSYRRNRAGRAVLAVRENMRAAASYSVNSAWTRLGAFAVSGAIAAMAGVLSAYQSRAVDATTYGVDRSIGIFIITVIGGLTSLPGAVFGAVMLESVRHFGGRGWSLLVTGPGLLLVLLMLPGGFAEGFYRIRDAFLRWVANRHSILVPSLVADRRVAEPAPEEASVIEQAEHHVETVETFDVVAEASIWCPVCGAQLALDEAAEHEHLKAGAGAPGAGASERRSRVRSRQ